MTGIVRRDGQAGAQHDRACPTRSDQRGAPALGAVRRGRGRALAEDLTPLGDLTSALLPPEARADGRARGPRRRGAGRAACASTRPAQVDPTITVEWRADDGDHIAAGQTLAVIAGPLPAILTAERTALELPRPPVGRRHGHPPLRRRPRGGGRDAPQGVGHPQDHARPAGAREGRGAGRGRANHRGNLSDWVLLKDNHLAVLGIDEAVRRTRDRWPGRLAHVECDTFAQVVARRSTREPTPCCSTT